jgi:hypothetical protein
MFRASFAGQKPVHIRARTAAQRSLDLAVAGEITHTLTRILTHLHVRIVVVKTVLVKTMHTYCCCCSNDV